MVRNLKDSGIEWIGNVPKHWDIIKVKHVFVNNKRVVKEKADDYERLALTLNGVIKRSKEDNEGLQPEEYSGYQILEKDELVFKLIDLENVRTSRVGISPFTGIVSPAYITLKNEAYSKFGYYYFYSMWQREIFNRLGDAGVRSNLGPKDLMNLPFIVPPKCEMDEIVNFLDQKISQIDKLIEVKREFILNLDLYKKSLIYEVVTGKKEI